jgi:pyrroloquinoline quinone (PQQ) biosynthesis protein C
MTISHREYGVRRVYQTTPVADGSVAFRLHDRVAELGPPLAAAYRAFVEWLPTDGNIDKLKERVGTDGQTLERMIDRLLESRLVYRRAEIPATLSGEAFHRDVFTPILPSWLEQAFSHPFWERMTSGRGSTRMFSGWLIELYHYTRNANRHMPLSCAHTREKPLKLLRAKHYSEEWNHYHYFTKSLKALGFSEESVRESVPLPMTLALSNFMRQAAREDILAYSICSAVLEGTTTDRGAYSPYYQQCAEHYQIPKEAIQPIFAHLDLDVQYQHSDLFLDILKNVEAITAERAARVLDYGHQLVEHIWMWTENIERYYDVPTNPVPRQLFDPVLD